MPRGRNRKPKQSPTIFFFFGNSYTKFHTTGYRVKQFYNRGRAPGTTNNINTPSNLRGGLSFAHHVQYMRQGGWDFKDKHHTWVILQEQSEIPAIPKYLPQSIWAAKALDQYIQQAPDSGGDSTLSDGASTMFFMTWGRRDGYKGRGVEYPDFLSHNAAILQGYLEYVKATSTPQRPTYMAPVGLVFQTIYNDCVARGEDPRSKESTFWNLYKSDASHPTGLGSITAGLTIATAMTGYDPKKQYFDPEKYKGEMHHIEAIQDAVSRTILETFESGLIRYPWRESWTVREQQQTRAAVDLSKLALADTCEARGGPQADDGTIAAIEKLIEEGKARGGSQVDDGTIAAIEKLIEEGKRDHLNVENEFVNLLAGKADTCEASEEKKTNCA